MAGVPWGDIAPGAAGGLTVAGIVWRGFRTLSRKLDHVERIPVIEAKVDKLAIRQEEDRTTLRDHMADEERVLAAERSDRAEGQAANAQHLADIDGRLGRVEATLTAIAEGTPP